MKPSASHKHCLDCNYILDALPEPRCPECGRAFDLQDPSTYRTANQTYKWRRWAKPPGMWHTLGVLVVTLLILEGRSRPAAVVDIMPASWPCCVVFILGSALLVAYCMHLDAFYRARQLSNRAESHSAQRGGWRWFVAPLCVALAFSTLVHWPLHLRFALSRSAFDAEVQMLMTNPAWQAGTPLFVTKNNFVGWYYVERIATDPSSKSVKFFTGTSLIDPVGFIYSPDQPTAFDVGLPASWYVFED